MESSCVLVDHGRREQEQVVRWVYTHSAVVSSNKTWRPASRCIRCHWGTRHVSKTAVLNAFRNGVYTPLPMFKGSVQSRV